jgi:gliding motility-associated-like protein
MARFRVFLFLIPLLLLSAIVYSQQDVEFHENARLLAGKNILKVKRDFNDVYLWVLAANNEVYRVNSLDYSVQDFTPLFQLYNLPFIDIAGQSKDVVFIATASNNIIQYKNGNIKLIGAAQGILGVVNSIGITAERDYYITTYYPTSPETLIIGTGNTIYRYNIANETALAEFTDNIDKPARVYDATYRSVMQTFNRIPYNEIDNVHYSSVLGNSYNAIFLWTGNSYGEHVYTATETTGIIYNYINLADYQMLFYGTENGLIEIGANRSHNSLTASKQFLTGTKVNKVATIYGLTTFGDPWQFLSPTQIKENLLVGTDNGLYFSNSFYSDFGRLYGPVSIEFLPYQPLANTVINDISVNHVLDSEPICEDGAWVATQKGLYYIKPDYGKFFGAQHLQALAFDSDYAGLIEEKETCGPPVKMTIRQSGYSGNSIQWYKDGVELSGATGRSFETNATGEYYAVVYDPCGIEHIETNHLKIKAIDRPDFKFDYDDKLQYCQDNTFVNLKVEGSDAYLYRWYKDGVLTGQTGKLITLNGAGKYKVEVSACTDTWEPSKEVTVEFISLPNPVITPNKPSYCTGDVATLTANITASPAYTLTWMRDNVALTAYTDQPSIAVTEPGNYTLALTSTQINCSQTALQVPVTFNAPPTLSIQQIVNTTLCDGETVSLKATYASGDIRWSTGETTGTIGVRSSGNYTATVKLGNCVTEQTTNVQFLPKPVLSLPDAALCQFTNESVLLTAPAGFRQYLWNGVAGSQTYTATSPGDVTLIVTDNNGCQASQTIRIASHCADIKLANTFTPNGDGINDTWVIAGLDDDPTAMVKIYNRYGTEVFENKGYSTPWEGTIKGKPAPAGVYYYMISAKGGKQILSGTLTVIY